MNAPPETPPSDSEPGKDPSLDLAGPDVIRSEARRAPEKPGVYRMYGGDGECLYVGKALNLKKRITQYAQGRLHSQRIALMVNLTRSMQIVVTASETEALLLEANYIKKLKPRFNVLLRDDKSFAAILIRRDHPAPQVSKHRGARTIKGDYFGPFASTWAVNQTLDTLQKAFLLRTCTDAVYESRERPCMLHQIKRCSAPCTGEISLKDYGALVRQAEGFLKGRSRAIVAELSERMQEASDQMRFEEAAALRDRVRALSTIGMAQNIQAVRLDEADVIAVHADGGQACVQVFFFRAGQNWGGRAYFPRVDKSDDEAVILGAFLAQFYEDKPVPRLILCSHAPFETELLAEAFSMKSDHRVEIAVPVRGEKRTLTDHALSNAREALGRKLAESSAQSKILAEIAEIFALPAPPRRIEVYDNSHIQGAQAVGGMIVAGPEGFVKTAYRKFNIDSEGLTPGDDYAMMREVMARRFSRLMKEEAAGESPPRPDLVLIDGGAGQLKAAEETLAQIGLEGLRLVGVAKGPDRDAGMERFFVPGRAPFMLPKKSPALYYLQRLRDEAHRYAIGAHRQRRKIDMKKNPLDGIEGIGPKRKRALLQTFGSARGVSRANVAELMRVEGVNEAMARRIHDFFRQG